MLHTDFAPGTDRLLSKGRDQQRLHERAAAVARERFGREVFVRGVVEVSNYCRENCQYCGMRRDNRSLARHRASAEQLAELLLDHRPASMTDLNIQAGEDPVAVREVVLPLIKRLRAETPLGISVCLGTLDPAIYDELREAGATYYILKFEAGNPADYARHQCPGTFVERLQHIRLLAENGWQVSSGFICGLPGQSPQSLMECINLAAALPLAGCSVSPFIPGDETPLASAPMSDLEVTLNCMALLRLMRPDWVIPSVSALNLTGASDGYRRGLRTGANLVTINLTPPDLRQDYLLYKRDRIIMTEERIHTAIASEGLTPSRRSLADALGETRATDPASAVSAPAAA